MVITIPELTHQGNGRNVDEILWRGYQSYRSRGVTPLRELSIVDLGELIKNGDCTLRLTPGDILSFVRDNYEDFKELTDKHGLEKMYVMLMLIYEGGLMLYPELVGKATEVVSSKGLYGLGLYLNSYFFTPPSPLESRV